jgi:hypothetical protein
MGLSGLPKSTEDQFVPEVMDLLHKFSTSRKDLQGLAHHLEVALTENDRDTIRRMTTGTRATRMSDNIKLKTLLEGVPSDKDLEFVRILRETCAAIFLLQVKFKKIDSVSTLTAQLRTSRVDNKRIFRAPSPGVHAENSAPSINSSSMGIRPLSLRNKQSHGSIDTVHGLPAATSFQSLGIDQDLTPVRGTNPLRPGR